MSILKDTKIAVVCKNCGEEITGYNWHDHKCEGGQDE